VRCRGGGKAGRRGTDEVPLSPLRGWGAKPPSPLIDTVLNGISWKKLKYSNRKLSL